jgi:hypothetical protein
MARIIGLGVRNQYGRMVWHRLPARVNRPARLHACLIRPEEALYELLDAEGPRLREWRPVHPARAPQVIAAVLQARAQQLPRLHREQIELPPPRRIGGPVIPYRLQPYLAALELVAMMSLATRALEGDL